MKTKPLIISLATVIGLGAATANADFRSDFSDRARVVSSTPVYDRINEPSKECWTETVGHEERVYRSNSNGGAIIGAIAGGLLGSTVGKGSGKVAAAAVGAATGAVIGDHMDDDNRYYRTSRPRQVERCQVSDNFRDVVVGYDVVYRYHGQEYATRLPYDPGQWLDVNVSVSVAGKQTAYSRNNSYHDDWR
jgi:uncharacterized protein YcfJ